MNENWTVYEDDSWMEERKRIEDRRKRRKKENRMLFLMTILIAIVLGWYWFILPQNVNRELRMIEELNQKQSEIHKKETESIIRKIRQGR